MTVGGRGGCDLEARDEENGQSDDGDERNRESTNHRDLAFHVRMVDPMPATDRAREV
jgi:hypothetical protein